MVSVELAKAAASAKPAQDNNDEQQQQQQQQDEDNSHVIDLSVLETWIDQDIVKHDNPLETQKVMHQELVTSRESFRSRLQTFHTWTYFCKPNSLSPLVCARFGWINPSVDMLQCVQCQANLAIIFHPKLTPSSVQKLVQIYQTKLGTAHKETCPFRLDAELYLQQQQSAATTQQDGNSTQTCYNIIPTYLASVVPRDFWELVEHPAPFSLMQTRFQSLCQHILKGEQPVGGAPPKWQLPDVSLPDDVLGFGVLDPSKKGDDDDDGDDNNTKSRRSPSRKSRMLSQLAFDPSKPYSAIGWEKPTLLTLLENRLRPNSEEDEIRAQTRAQGAWEALFEGMAALALFGWMPRDDQQQDDNQKVSKEKDSAVTLHCPVCLASLKFELEQYDWHHHSHGRKAKLGDNNNKDDTLEEGRPTKKRRVQEKDKTLNPLMGHRCYCPYVCGFPRDGERKTTPAWQTIATKLFVKPKGEESMDNHGEQNDTMVSGNDDDESTIDRILQLLQSSVSSMRPRNSNDRSS